MATVIPQRDVSRSLSIAPVAVVTIIALNVVMFIVELIGGDSFVERYALKPDEIVHGRQLETLFTSMFMHASLLHIAGNMVFLWVFGSVLEANYLGAARFSLYYLLCGLCAEALQIAVDPHSTVPNLGASGAIAGVMAGFLVVFPDDQIQSLAIFGIFFRHVRITAVVFIGIWFLIQVFSGVGSIAGAQDDGVAYWAHVGGFLGGLLLIKPFGYRAGQESSADGRHALRQVP
jgi:membrane associated rhomboid family serine protease